MIELYVIFGVVIYSLLVTYILSLVRLGHWSDRTYEVDYDKLTSFKASNFQPGQFTVS